MKQILSRPQKLKESIRLFKESKQTTDDYMKLFVVVVSVLRSGDGLLWSHVEEIVKEVIEE